MKAAFFSLNPLFCHPPSSPATLLAINWHRNPRRVSSRVERIMPLSPHRKTSKVATGVLGISGWIWYTGPSYGEITSQGESNRPIG